MDKHEFTDYVIAHLKEHLPEQYTNIHLTTKDVLKSSDQIRTGIVLDNENADGISPIIYIEDYYTDYKTGNDLNAVLTTMAQNVARGMEQTSFSRDDVLPIIQNYDLAKTHLCIHLCDTAENTRRLQEMPHTELSDFSLTYYIQLPAIYDDNSIGSVAVTNDILKSWGISEDTLHTDALAMTAEQRPMLCNLDDMMASMIFDTVPANLMEQTAGHSEVLPDSLFILTNVQKTFGASMLAREDLLHDAADRLGCSFYILPSSIHEVLLMPENSSLPVAELCAMVKSINQQTVPANDQLSDKVQFYDRETGILENAARREQRLAQQKTVEKTSSVQADLKPDVIQYDLYQVRSGEDTRSVCFSGLKALHSFGLKVDRRNYEKVYSGDIQSNGKSNSEVLESLFEKFNLQHPADYRSRSMSVSDVVVLHENGRDTAHFCDSIGFVEVPQFLQPTPAVNLETTRLYVDGHEGTWHTIDSTEIQGRTYFLMEHDEFGSSVAQIAVDENGKLAAQDFWNGITPEIARMIAEEQESNPTKTTARQEAIVQSSDTDVLQADPARKNYLKAAEEYTEENYNNVDGRMSTQNKLTPGDDTLSRPEYTEETSKSASTKEKPSVLYKLHSKQAEIAAKAPTPKSEKSRSNDAVID